MENIYTLKINNMDTRDHSYSIQVTGDYPFNYLGKDVVSVREGEILSMPVRIELDPGLMNIPNTDIIFVVEAMDNERIHAQQENRFIGPRLQR